MQRCLIFLATQTKQNKTNKTNKAIYWGSGSMLPKKAIIAILFHTQLSHQPCFTGLLNKPMAQDSWLNLYWAWPSSTPACFEFYSAYAVSLNKSQDIVFYYSWWLPSNMSLIQWCSTEVQGRNSEKKARSHQFQQYLQYQEMGLSNKQTISRQFLGKPYLQDMIFNVCLCVCLSVYACVCVCVNNTDQQDLVFSVKLHSFPSTKILLVGDHPRDVRWPTLTIVTCP